MAIDQFRIKVELAREASTRLVQYLAELPAEQMSVPSACDRWQVREAAAHLGGAAQFHKNMIVRGLGGESAPPEAVLRQDPAIPASERIAQAAVSLRERLGDQVVANLETQYGELMEVLDGIRSDDLPRPCWHPRGTTSVAEYVGLVVQEVGIHGWDMRSRLEPDYQIAPGLLDALEVEAEGWVLSRFRTAPPLAQPVRYRFDTGPGRDMVAEGGTLRIESPGSGPADVTFRCDPETYVLLAYGRLSPEEMLKAGRLSVEGDEALAAEFWRRVRDT